MIKELFNPDKKSQEPKKIAISESPTKEQDFIIEPTIDAGVENDEEAIRRVRASLAPQNVPIRWAKSLPEGVEIKQAQVGETAKGISLSDKLGFLGRVKKNFRRALALAGVFGVTAGAFDTKADDQSQQDKTVGTESVDKITENSSGSSTNQVFQYEQKNWSTNSTSTNKFDWSKAPGANIGRKVEAPKYAPGYDSKSIKAEQTGQVIEKAQQVGEEGQPLTEGSVNHSGTVYRGGDLSGGDYVGGTTYGSGGFDRVGGGRYRQDVYKRTKGDYFYSPMDGEVHRNPFKKPFPDKKRPYK